MAGSPISQEMLLYFMQLNEAEKKSVLELVKTFITNRPNEMQPQHIEDYDKEIEEADADIEVGNFILNEDVVKKYSKK